MPVAFTETLSLNLKKMYSYNNVLILFRTHTQPLFDSLNILCFHKLVIQRISLMMFKNEVGLVPKPISQLFTKNNEYHDYNTIDTVVLFISQLGEVKRSTDLLAFMELTFGII